MSDNGLTKETTDRWVTVNGIKLHYNKAGAGPALICTHGGGPGANAWDNSKYVIDELSRHFRVILLDLPGWGESQKLVKRDGVPLDIYIARLLLDFMDAVGIERAHQYGSSQFAPACLRFGIEYPDRTGKIVVQSSEFGPLPADPGPGIKSLIAFAQDPSRDKMQTIFEYFTPREEFRPASVIDNRFEKAMAPDHLASRREFPNAANSNLVDVLPKLQAEVLYVCGNDDGMIPVTTALDALKWIPRSRAVIWGDRSGHFVLTEHAAEYARIVTDFLTHWGAAPVIIDVHSHLFPPDLMAAIAKAGGRLPQLEAAPLQSMALGARHELMLESQVDLGLLSVGVLQPYHEGVRTAVDLAKVANDTYLQTSADSGGWLATWAALPLPHVDAALAELDRIAGDPGCVGVTLGTSVLDLDLDDKALEPVYAALNARGTTVFVHPSMAFDGFGADDLGMQRSIGGMIEDTVAGIRLLLSGVVVRYPKINFIVPHLGGTLPFIYGRVRRHIAAAEKKWADEGLVSADDAFTGLSRLWWDTATRHVPALTCAVETLGADRLVFGTDYPYTKTRAEFARRLAHIRDLPIGSEQQAGILGDSVAALLGLAK